MLILTSRFLLPIYLIPFVYYFLKFFFIFTVMLALFVMICSSASAWKIQHNASKFRTKYEELKGYVKHNNGHYTNTWVSFIEGGSYAVQKIAERHGYVVLNEIFPNTYHLHHPKVEKRSLEPEKHFSRRLVSHPQVLYAKQQITKRRLKRDFIMLPFPPSKSKTVGGDDDSFREVTWQKVNSSHRGILLRATFAKNDPKWPDMWLIITGLLVDTKPADLHLFRNYKPPGELAFPGSIESNGFLPLPKPEDQLVWMAARASGAAPSYFRMYGRFLDGGLIANNPTLDALTEIHEYNLAMKHLGQPEKVTKPGVVVSVGTGCNPVTEVKDIDVFRPESVLDGIKLMRGVTALGTLLVDQATQADGRVVERARAWCDMIDVPYFRFCPQLSEEVAMDEKDDHKLVNMLWETKAYMVQNHTDVLKVVSLLKN